MKAILKRGSIWFLRLSGILFLTLLLLEFCFRYQVVDFYSAELHALNPDLEKKGKTLLIFGDSFTADPQGWVSTVRDSMSGWRVVNAAIPGTGSIQASLIARRRFNRFRPDLVVYQVYTGNDLFDIRYPQRGPVGLGRKTYWFFANRFRVLNFINYKWGQSLGKPEMVDMKNATAAPADSYNEREKVMIKAEPGLYRDQVMVTGDRAADFDLFLEKLDYLHSWCREMKCPFVVIVIPHSAQVSELAYAKMSAIGAEMWAPGLKGDYAFPFFVKTVAHFRNAEGVKVVTPLHFFQTHPGKDSLYFPFDPHLTRFGQKELGAWMNEQLTSFSKEK